MDSQQVVRKNVPAELDEVFRRQYAGGWTPNFGLYGPKKYCMRDIHFKPVSELIPHMKLRSDDIWIGGYLRSGTHWLAEMTWLINNNLDFDTARNVNHQDRVTLFERHGSLRCWIMKSCSLLFWSKIFFCHMDYIRPLRLKHVMVHKEKTCHAYIGKCLVCFTVVTLFGENHLQPPTLETYDNIPSTRFFKTHVPLSLLPPKLLETSKMLYVARDPRDMLVSLFHFETSFELKKFQGSIEELFDLFIRNNFEFCPYFEHVLEYWNSRYHPNLIFLFYEDMVKNLPSMVRRISKFFDKEFTESQNEQLCEYLQFSKMKKSGTFNTEKFFKQDIKLIRKGKIGGWQEEFTEDMKKRMEQWIAEKLKDTDLVFPSMQQQ